MRISDWSSDVCSSDLHLARLDVADDDRSRTLAKHRAGKENHELIGPDDPARIIDDADAVAVAVERNADIASPFDHRSLNLLQIFRHRGIRVMSGKGDRKSTRLNSSH